MFKFIKEKIKQASDNLEAAMFNSRFSANQDMDIKLARIAYYGKHEPQYLQEKIGKMKLINNYEYTNYTFRGSKTIVGGYGHVADDVAIFSYHDNNLRGRQKPNNGWSEHEQWQAKRVADDPKLMKLSLKLDKKNKLKMSIDEIPVEYVYCSHGNKHIGRVYEFKTTINDEKVDLDEIKKNLPSVYQTLENHVNETLQSIRNSIILERQEQERAAQKEIDDRDDDIKGFMR